MPTRVLLVDDHELFRRGLLMLLSHEPDIEVVGEAADGPAAVAMARRVRPDLVLVDLRRPGGRAGVCRVLKRAAPNTTVIAMAVEEDESELYDAVRAGASGYLLKEIPLAEVAGAIRSAADGAPLLSPHMAGRLLAELAPGGPDAGVDRPAARLAGYDVAPRLSESEQETLRLLARAAPYDLRAGRPDPASPARVAGVLRKVHQYAQWEASLHAMRRQDAAAG